VILVLSNPEVEQQTVNARLALQAAEATLESLRAQLQNDLLTQRSQAASLDADYKQAQMEAEANDILAKQKLVSGLVLRQSQLKADTLRTRFDRILIDVPPVAPLADLHILAPMVDALLMIVRAGVTPKPAIERALAGLDPNKILGLVLNESGAQSDVYDTYEGYGYIAG